MGYISACNSKDSVQSTRLLSFDQTNVLKGIAISLIIICHFGNHYTRFTTSLGGIGVAIFLILSGYGLSISYKKKQQLKNYWKKRFKSVFIPYFIVEFFRFIFVKDLSFTDFILDILLIRPQCPLGWYLNYLILWYITFWLINFCFDKLKITRWKAAAFIIISLFYAMYYQNKSALRFEQSFSFIIGVFMAYCPLMQGKKINKKIFIIIFYSIGILLLGMKQISYIRTQSKQVLLILDLIFKTSFALAIIVSIQYMWVIKLSFIGKCKSILIKAMIPLGLSSYELYLIHGYALKCYELPIPKWQSTLSTIISTVFGTALLYCIDLLIQKKFNSRI